MKHALLAIAVLLPAVAAAQPSSYERFLGAPVDVPLTDLIGNGAFYTNRAVRTQGRLDMVQGGERGWVLKDMFGGQMPITPKAEVAQEFEDGARFKVGQELIITGVLTERPPQVDGPASTHIIEFWRFELPPDREKERLSKARGLSIADLLKTPGKHDGAVVRVAGQFRGRNLYSDLPAATQRNRTDWVIADEDKAVWVTGKKPKGEGWELDATMKRDTGKWIEVLGEPRTRNGITILKALRVILVAAPVRAEKVAATPTPPPKPKVPPVVVFALPLDGDTEVPGDSRFVVQFSKDMDETSFKDRIVLRYLGPPRPGVRPLDFVTLFYDAGRKALTVDPGDRLSRGAELELRLLPGIKDIDGLELIPRRGDGAADLIDTLRYRIGT
jgi:hypothetical protein